MGLEQIGLWVGFVLTLMIFSYILGDNFLYRLAVYIFVGLAAGYAAVVTWDSVLRPWLDNTFLSPDRTAPDILFGVLPLLLGALLLLKASPRLGRFGNLALAVLIGVGAAVALVGAITGTLLPLASATGNQIGVNRVNGVLMLIGVICTLVYFQYLARRTPGGQIRRGPLVSMLGFVGQSVVVITLGSVYAAAILTSLTIFSERVSFLLARIGGGS